MRRRCEGSGREVERGLGVARCDMCGSLRRVTAGSRLYAHQRAATAEERAAMGVTA